MNYFNVTDFFAPGGTTEGAPAVGEVIENAGRLRELTREAEVNFGVAFDDIDVEARSGFSLRMDVDGTEQRGSDTGSGQIIVETLSIDRIVYVRISNTLDLAANEAVVGYRVLQGDGRPLPAWVRQADDGLLLAEVPAGDLTLDLRISAIKGDGEVITRSVSIDLKSGEVSEKTLDMTRAPTFSEQLRAGAGR